MASKRVTTVITCRCSLFGNQTSSSSRNAIYSPSMQSTLLLLFGKRTHQRLLRCQRCEQDQASPNCKELINSLETSPAKFFRFDAVQQHFKPERKSIG
eukprot:764115-Hanusia_phi.AAC.2